MEVQLAVKTACRTDGPPPRHVGGDTTTKAAIVPNYLKPSTGSCHHACKYGGAHTFQDNDVPAPHQPKPKARKQQQPSPRVPDHQRTRNRPLISRARLVPRKLFSRGGGDKAQVEAVTAAAAVVSSNKEKKKKALADESVEWKDIAAYDTVPVPSDHGPLPDHQPDDKQSAAQLTDGAKSQKESPDRKLVVKPPVAAAVGPKPTTTTMTGNQAPAEPPTTKSIDDTKGGVKPPRGRTKKPAVSVSGVARTKAAVVDPAQLVVGDGYRYQPLSPSLLRERANLLRDLEEEMTMARDATTTTTDVANELKAACGYSLDPEEYCAAAAGETGRRPVPAHRRVKSTSMMSIGSGRSVRFPFTRQGSKNYASAAFKLRSKSSRGPITLPSQEEEKPAIRCSRSRRGSSMGGGDDVAGSTSTGRGVQLRIRSLRRRGVGGPAGGAGAGFAVPAVSLRHQKTLERKRSQRLYNSVIEETASRLVKTRKSRVKALVGAFESIISKIAK